MGQQATHANVTRPIHAAREDLAIETRDLQPSELPFGTYVEYLENGDSVRFVVSDTEAVDGEPEDPFYDVEEASMVMGSIRDSLMASLSSPELAPLRGYVLKFVPTFPEGSYVRSESTDEILIPRSVVQENVSETERRLERIDSRASSGDLTLDLRVTSTPAEAQFWIDAYGGGSVRNTRTNAVLTNLYRGYFQYEVTKPGYKRMVGELNLIDEEGELLVCNLEPKDENITVSEEDPAGDPAAEQPPPPMEDEVAPPCRLEVSP
jgi:hypothetical protein